MFTAESSFYCHPCADNSGQLNGLHSLSSSPTNYQISKAEKHTRLLKFSTGVHSVLISGSTSDYEHLGRMAVEKGFLEIEPSGIRTLIYPTTDPIGMVYDNGCLESLANSFRWVLSTNSGRAHGYAVSSSDYMGRHCNGCAIALTS